MSRVKTPNPIKPIIDRKEITVAKFHESDFGNINEKNLLNSFVTGSAKYERAIAIIKKKKASIAAVTIEDRKQKKNVSLFEVPNTRRC